MVIHFFAMRSLRYDIIKLLQAIRSNNRVINQFFSHQLHALPVIFSMACVVCCFSPAFAETSTTLAPKASNHNGLAKTKVESNKSVDWTPVLKTMQNGCDLPDIENAPDAIQSSVTNNPIYSNSMVADGYKTLSLKNATAWGYPIKKIQYGSQGPGFSSATIYFTDNRFMNLRSKFYVQTVSGKLTAQNKTIIKDSNAFAGQYLANGVGYNDGRSGVYFSQKNKTITCSWAHL